jgi:hypothetical protein
MINKQEEQQSSQKPECIDVYEEIPIIEDKHTDENLQPYDQKKLSTVDIENMVLELIEGALLIH